MRANLSSGDSLAREAERVPYEEWGENERTGVHGAFPAIRVNKVVT